MTDQKTHPDEEMAEAQTQAVLDSARLEGLEVESLTQWQLARRKFFQHKLAMTSLVILLVVFAAAMLADFIAPYDFAHEGGHDPERERKLLLHRRQIDRIAGSLAEKGLTLVPLQVYFKDGKAKIELGLAKGKATVDKRRSLRDKEHQREMARAARRR